jgi:hypothetical protein
MLDSPEDVCPGQAWFEYPATSVPFSSSARNSDWLLTVVASPASSSSLARSRSVNSASLPWW